MDEEQERQIRERMLHSDTLRESMETTPSEMIREMIHPTLEKGENGEEGNNALNKELKISNLDPWTRDLVVEMTDVLLQAKEMGANEFAYHLLGVRDTFLSASSSLNGFERKLQVTEINIHKLPETKSKSGFNIFSTNKKGDGKYEP